MISKFTHEFQEKYNNLEAEELGDYVKSAFNEVLKGQTIYQAYRNKNTALFEIIECIIENVVIDNIEKAPFFNNFVEVKNRMHEDITGWYSCEDSILSVSCFAGNHYDTNCVRLKAGEEYVLPSEWVYVDIQEELEKFMLGISSFEYVENKICHVINKHIQDRIYMNFQNMLEYSKQECRRFGILRFESNGQDLKGFENLCDAVRENNECGELIIAGNRNTLCRLGNLISEESVYSVSETIAGCKIMLVSTNTSCYSNLNNNLFILGGAEHNKPIKLDLIGDTRIRLDEFDLIAQTCIGVGMLVPNGYGVFTFDK